MGHLKLVKNCGGQPGVPRGRAVSHDGAVHGAVDLPKIVLVPTPVSASKTVQEFATTVDFVSHGLHMVFEA